MSALFDSLPDFADKLDYEGGVEGMVLYCGASPELCAWLDEQLPGLGEAWGRLGEDVRFVQDALEDYLP